MRGLRKQVLTWNGLSFFLQLTVDGKEHLQTRAVEALSPSIRNTEPINPKPPKPEIQQVLLDRCLNGLAIAALFSPWLRGCGVLGFTGPEEAC